MNEWNCSKCGYHGGEFILKGNGFVRCPKCDTLSFVGQDKLYALPSGELGTERKE